jgi:magnesium transporter
MTEDAIDRRLGESVLDHARNDFVRIDADGTVGAALDAFRAGGAEAVGSRVVYLYALDGENRLQGVVPVRRLLLGKPETPVREIMVRDVIALRADATLLDACDLFLFHKLLALPIIDDERRMLGIVDVELYTDELNDLARRDETDDVFQLIGVHVASVRSASLGAVFLGRFPWLLANIAGGLLCAAVAGIFQGVLDAVIALALFIPVVLALAESVSIQSLTLTLQAQHGSGVKREQFLRQLLREVATGVMLGLGCGMLVGLAAGLWQGAWLVSLCILASIAASISFATVYGLLVPTALRAARRDPRIAAGPITLALTDLTTMFVYLGLAAMLLSP